MIKPRTKQNKKGQVNGGLQMVGAVLIAFMVLGVIAISIFLALTPLISTSIIPNKVVPQAQFGNETINLTTAGNAPASVSGLSGVILFDLVVTNASSGETVEAANFSVTGGVLANITQEFGDTFVNVSATFTHTVNSDAVVLVNNVTEGTTLFFTNASAIFSILGAVIIILAIGLIIFAVFLFNRFTSSGGGSEGL